MREFLSFLLVVPGCFFALTSVVGLWRMPDLYTRIHGSGCLDSLASGLILIGLSLTTNSLIDVGKYILLYFLILLSSPGDFTGDCRDSAAPWGTHAARFTRRRPMMESLGNWVLISLITTLGLAVCLQRDLLVAAIYAAIYSLLCALFYTWLDAVDVAFTEASVGVVVGTLPIVMTLLVVGRYESANVRFRPWALLIAVATVLLLFYAAAAMPELGLASNITNEHIIPRYLNDSTAEISPIPNVVTSVLASYRGYDTMGEVGVVFAAAIGVLALLSSSSHQPEAQVSRTSGALLRDLLATMFAPILIFALYVQWHGDFGPGGGFQAGVIFASGVIALGLTHGTATAKRVVPLGSARFLVAFGWLLYIGTGLKAMWDGGEFLNYSWLADDPLHGQHYGILAIELGVGITVAAAMISIYYAFAGVAVDERLD